MAWRKSILAFLPRRLPAEVRDSHALAQYKALAAQVPVAYCALLPVVIAAIPMASPGAPPLVRFGIPLGIAGISLVRLVFWLQRPRALTDARAARRAILRSGLISALIALTCSIWGTISWYSAPASSAAYFPLMITVGTLTPVFAQAMSRSSAFLSMVAGFGPIATALLVSGDRFATTAGALILVTCFFLVHMIWQQNHRFIELLVLERRMHEEAQTDPLTGLVNRRALTDRFATWVAQATTEARPAVIQIDIDGFKAVNERLGHAAGDEVLRQVANRLRHAAGRGAMVCRLGSDEFAVLVVAGEGRSCNAIAQALIASLVQPFSGGGEPVRIGASLGAAGWPEDGRSLTELCATADRRLSLAKAQFRRGERDNPGDQAVRKAWVIG